MKRWTTPLLAALAVLLFASLAEAGFGWEIAKDLWPWSPEPPNPPFVPETEDGSYLVKDFSSFHFYLRSKAAVIDAFTRLYPDFGSLATITMEVLFGSLLLWMFFNLIWGDTKYKSSDFLKTFVGMAAAACFLAYFQDVGNARAFLQQVTTPVMNLAAYFLTLGKSTDIAQLFADLDGNFFKIINYGGDVLPPIDGFSALRVFFQRLTVFLCIFCLYVFMYLKFLFMFTTSVIAFYVLAFLAPFIVVALFLKETRSIASSWVKAIVSYGMLIVFSSIIMGVFVAGLDTWVDAMVADASLEKPMLDMASLFTVLWCAVGVAMLTKANEFVQHMGGARISGKAATGLAAVGAVGMGAAKLAGAVALPVAAKGGALLRKGASNQFQKRAPEAYAKYSSMKERAGNVLDTSRDRFGKGNWQPGHVNAQKDHKVNQARAEEKWKDYQNNKAQAPEKQKQQQINQIQNEARWEDYQNTPAKQAANEKIQAILQQGAEHNKTPKGSKK